jgi:hypothetical protein
MLESHFKEQRMDTITGKILKLHNWPDGKIIGIAKNIAEQLGDQGLDRETILARLEQCARTRALSLPMSRWPTWRGSASA